MKMQKVFGFLFIFFYTCVCLFILTRYTNFMEIFIRNFITFGFVCYYCYFFSTIRPSEEGGGGGAGGGAGGSGGNANDNDLIANH